MKSQISSLVCLLAVIAAASSPAVEARPKRSVVYAAPVVASLPVVHSHVVHANPTSVVRTEQVRSGNHASYSYSSEVKSEPVVHTHTHAAAVPVAAVPVATTHHTVAAVPSVHHYGYYPAAYSYYSPYSYVIGK